MSFVTFNKPDINFRLLKRILEVKNGNKVKEKVVNFFKKITKKNYVIITDSCRTSLYLAHKFSNNDSKLVHVSPLTCSSAISPIIAAGKAPSFTKVDRDTLLSDEQNLMELIRDQKGSVQTIGLGGNLNQMDKIKKACKDSNTLLIEDCAQSFGSSFNGQQSGSFGDISCFSLSKNLYSLGGGIIALNDKKTYGKILRFYDRLSVQSNKVSYYKILKYLFDTNSNRFIFKHLYKALMKFTRKKQKDELFFFRNLKKPNLLTINSIYFQLLRFKGMNKRRTQNAEYIINNLHSNDYFTKQKIESNVKSSFVRLYLSSIKKTLTVNSASNELGIQCRHLKSRYGNLMQDRFDEKNLTMPFINKSLSDAYFSIHDNLISIPLSSKMSHSDKNKIINYLQAGSNENNN